MEQNALRSWHATMYKFVTSMVLCGLGMQQCAMYTATIQKTTFFELGVYSTMGDVALTNITRETKYFHDCDTFQNKCSSPFFSLGYVLSMFFNFGHFSVSRSYKKDSYEKKNRVYHC